MVIDAHEAEELDRWFEDVKAKFWAEIKAANKELDSLTPEDLAALPTLSDEALQRIRQKLKEESEKPR